MYASQHFSTMQYGTDYDGLYFPGVSYPFTMYNFHDRIGIFSNQYSTKISFHSKTVFTVEQQHEDTMCLNKRDTEKLILILMLL